MNWLRRHLKFIVLVMLVAFIFGALTGSRIPFDFNKLIQPPEVAEEIRTMVAPAVDNNGNGVPSTLIVTVKPGTGQVLVNINNVLAGFDTQESAITAAQEAGKYTRTNLNNLDIIYSIKAETPLISGASAGAAMTIATIAAIEDKELDPRVSITGAITNESMITRVGGVAPKSEAVRSRGIEIFLVPSGQSMQESYYRDIVCRHEGSVEICQTHYLLKGITLGEDIGLQVIEVSNIDEAVGYFIK